MTTLLGKVIDAIKEMQSNPLCPFKKELELANQIFGNATQMSIQDKENLNLAFGFNNGKELDQAELCQQFPLEVLAHNTGKNWETKRKSSTLELWFKPKEIHNWLSLSNGD